MRFMTGALIYRTLNSLYMCEYYVNELWNCDTWANKVEVIWLRLQIYIITLFVCLFVHSYLVISQSLDVVQSSEYCLATAIGARHTLAPLVAEMSQIKPDSQSASRRHNSPNLRPYANRQFPITKEQKEKKIYVYIYYIILL